MLDAAGAEVTVFTSAREALERIDTIRPDVMVVDIRIPVPKDRTKALQNGLEMHLAKSVDPCELVATVAALAKRAKSRECGVARPLTPLTYRSADSCARFAALPLGVPKVTLVPPRSRYSAVTGAETLSSHSTNRLRGRRHERARWLWQ